MYFKTLLCTKTSIFDSYEWFTFVCPFTGLESDLYLYSFVLGYLLSEIKPCLVSLVVKCKHTLSLQRSIVSRS